jgi:hypothetical protein
MTSRQVIANVLAGVIFGPFIVLSFFFWGIWGMWGYVLGLIAGPEDQIRIWHVVTVGPSYGSSLMGPLWWYFGHEPEKRRMAAVADGASLHFDVPLIETHHEHAAWATRAHQEPIYNARGAESFPLEGA